MNRTIASTIARQKVLLMCGVLSSLVYVLATIAGALRWDGYSSISQTVSELFAFGAPSRPVVVLLFYVYDALLIAFGWSVWSAAAPSRDGGTATRRALHIVGAMLLGIGVIGLAGPFASMNLRGSEPTLTDTLHIILTSAIVVMTVIAIAFGATAFGRSFRIYSIATIAVLILFGAWSAFDGPRMAANLPTPWLGVKERINIGAYLLWVIVLGIGLLQRTKRPPSIQTTHALGS